MDRTPSKTWLALTRGTRAALRGHLAEMEAEQEPDVGIPDY